MNLETLKLNWSELANRYYQDDALVNFYWEEICRKYTGKKRYYHNLKHIESMLAQAKKYQNKIIDYDELLFAIWFHDIFYKSTSKKNEEKSAEFAKVALSKISVNNINIDKIYQLIISTKAHKIIWQKDSDNQFMLDFDLSILGQNWESYKTYINSIRKEYSIYPDFLYNPGRKKVLENFLKRDSLFFTDFYKNRYEEKARENLSKEIKLST
jgi:predicted metal-dependent HD superfamily phosphohydrolase